MTLAQRVSQEMRCTLGRTVGYRVRFDEKLSPQTRIKFLTDGMLLREAILDPELSKYGVIVLDEAHERTVNSDVLLAIVKGLCKRRPELRVVVMSATLQIDKFRKYFGCPEDGGQNVVKVEGRTFPIQIYNTVTPQQDYIQAAIRAVVQILLFEDTGDILVFLTGQEEIEETQAMLDERLKAMSDQLVESDKVVELNGTPDQKAAPYLICPLFANMPPSEQAKAFQTNHSGRKVILSTNIAETSVTIPGIKYIVDSGLQKTRVFKSSTGVDSLKVTPISKNSATQRAGRAGRESKGGKCFRIYTKDTH